MSACRHFLVSGRVQGVFFRATTRAKAQELGLTGWVRNLADGRVEVVACGAPDLLSQLERWLWQGPSYARVTEVAARDVEPHPLKNFSVR